MPRIDEQECPGVSDAEPKDVAKLDKLKKKPSLILIASKTPPPSPIYKSLQHEPRKPIPCVPDACRKPIDYFRLFITARHTRLIATYINLNAVKQVLTKPREKSPRSRLWHNVIGPEIDRFMGILLAMGCMKLNRTESY